MRKTLNFALYFNHLLSSRVLPPPMAAPRRRTVLHWRPRSLLAGKACPRAWHRSTLLMLLVAAAARLATASLEFRKQACKWSRKKVSRMRKPSRNFSQPGLAYWPAGKNSMHIVYAAYGVDRDRRAPWLIAQYRLSLCGLETRGGRGKAGFDAPDRARTALTNLEKNALDVYKGRCLPGGGRRDTERPDLENSAQRRWRTFSALLGCYAGRAAVTRH